MSILKKVKKRFFQPSNYNMDYGIQQNQLDNTPGFFRSFNDYHDQYQNQFQQNVDNGCNYNQHFTENPSNQNFYQNDFNVAYGNQSFEGNYECSNKKRPREYYKENYQNNDYNCGLNVAKRQKLSGPSVQYAFKKSSEYPQPMRKVLNLLFESEITADGWEKVNGKFHCHIKIRQNMYYGMGNTIANAGEQVAETVLRALCNFKFENISWPRQLLPFRLEQSFADAIEMLV